MRICIGCYTYRMKKRFNQWIEISTFEWLKDRATELELERGSVAKLIAKMIEFARKNWKEFIRTLNT